MYLNNAAMSLSGLGFTDAFRKCRKDTWNDFGCDTLPKDTPTADVERCRNDRRLALMQCNKLNSGFGGGNAVLDNMKGQGLDLSKLTVAAPTVSTLKPAVSPAVVNPSMSVVPAYSTTGLPISNFGSNQSYGTAINPIRLGEVEVDTTPEFLKGNNKYYTIGAAAVILGGIYYATTHKKGRRRK